jgi:hypothetical protein
MPTTGGFFGALTSLVHWFRREKQDLVAVTVPDGIPHLVASIGKDNQVETACGLTATYKALLRLPREEARFMPRACETCFPYVYKKS